ncbi:uncharacterized protein LOC143036594 isoform X2 [Oratosquilla oratoria]
MAEDAGQMSLTSSQQGEGEELEEEGERTEEEQTEVEAACAALLALTSPPSFIQDHDLSLEMSEEPGELAGTLQESESEESSSGLTTRRPHVQSYSLELGKEELDTIITEDASSHKTKPGFECESEMKQLSAFVKASGRCEKVYDEEMNLSEESECDEKDDKADTAVNSIPEVSDRQCNEEEKVEAESEIKMLSASAKVGSSIFSENASEVSHAKESDEEESSSSSDSSDSDSDSSDAEADGDEDNDEANSSAIKSTGNHAVDNNVRGRAENQELNYEGAEEDNSDEDDDNDEEEDEESGEEGEEEEEDEEEGQEKECDSSQQSDNSDASNADSSNDSSDDSGNDSDSSDDSDISNHDVLNTSEAKSADFSTKQVTSANAETDQGLSDESFHGFSPVKRKPQLPVKRTENTNNQSLKSEVKNARIVKDNQVLNASVVYRNSDSGKRTSRELQSKSAYSVYNVNSKSKVMKEEKHFDGKPNRGTQSVNAMVKSKEISSHRIHTSEKSGGHSYSSVAMSTSSLSDSDVSGKEKTGAPQVCVGTDVRKNISITSAHVEKSIKAAQFHRNQVVKKLKTNDNSEKISLRDSGKCESTSRAGESFKMDSTVTNLCAAKNITHGQKIDMKGVEHSGKSSITVESVRDAGNSKANQIRPMDVDETNCESAQNIRNLKYTKARPNATQKIGLKGLEGEITQVGPVVRERGLSDSRRYSSQRSIHELDESPRVVHLQNRMIEDDDELDTDDLIPIQAEVIMSDGTESGIDYDEFYNPDDFEKDDEKENQVLVDYLGHFVNGITEGDVTEYPPHHEPPKDITSLTHWQLEKVSLPPYIPTVPPPPWIRLTIPAEGYKCHSCGDMFFIESSLIQHRERRSVWISLECGPCDAKLTFYNRCALKDHLRDHQARGEGVDDECIDVRSLPLQLSRLLQPIVVPVPQRIRQVSRSHKSHRMKPVNDKPPALRPLHKTKDFWQPPLENMVYEAQEKQAVKDKRLMPERSVRCYLCERMFYTQRELMTHMRTDQPWSDHRVECVKCQLVLPSVCAAKAHILTHQPANVSNISVCPECGERCDTPREFVHHLNTCGHQYRRSGILCSQCNVCFFQMVDDFLAHWIKEHCVKTYECVVCQSTFESLVFHKCTSPGQQVLATFRCLLGCPLCDHSVQLHPKEEKETQEKIKEHLNDAHPTTIKRIYFIYKSKFCTNAFISKDELRAHHDREHRRDNHYRTKTCTLHHEVLGHQHQYFNGQEPRHAFVTLPVVLSSEELTESKKKDVPTVSSLIDKTLYSEQTKAAKNEKANKVTMQVQNDLHESDSKVPFEKDVPPKKDVDYLEKLRPNVCYRCGYKYTCSKDFRRHKRLCEGEGTERECEVCSSRASGETFARHCLEHIQEGIVLCIYCNGTQFSSVKDLEQHFELHVHEQLTYPATCAFCGTSMPDVPTTLSHISEEHDPHHLPFDTTEFECEKCGRRFHGERGLSVHLTRCTAGSTVTLSQNSGRQCQVCTKALTPEVFGKHMVAHLEEGLLVCSLCDGRNLPSSMALLHHLEEHTNTLSYPSSCSMCGFKMSDPTTALTHVKEEHGFGNLHCADCDMHYNFTYQIQRHTDIVHKICPYAKRRYICWICRAYDHVKKETLMNHFRTVHGLSRDEVDEKAMIRTRGQGTMPTSQFIPTKPLGSKEAAGATSPSKEPEVKPKSLSPAKPSLEPQDFKVKQTKGKLVETETKPAKKPVVPEDVSRGEKNKVANNASKVEKNKVGNTKTTVKKKTLSNFKDDKLMDKPKVLIRKLPNSLIKNESQRRRVSRRGNIVVKKEMLAKSEMDEKKRKKRKKAFKCTLCGYGTNSKEKLDHHVEKHKSPEGHVCTECEASFVTRPSLARHMFFAHKIKIPVSEEEKQGEEESQKELNKRKKGELEESDDMLENKCRVCKKNCQTELELYSHLRTHGMAFLKLGRKKRMLNSESTKE